MDNLQKKRGGARLGAGRKVVPFELRKHTYLISMTLQQYKIVVAKYGSLTKAFETVLRRG